MSGNEVPQTPYDNKELIVIIGGVREDGTVDLAGANANYTPVQLDNRGNLKVLIAGGAVSGENFQQNAGPPSASTLANITYSIGDEYLNTTDSSWWVATAGGSNSTSVWVRTRVVYSGAGAPSGSTLVAGNYFQGDLYCDTTNEVMYFCDDSGTETTSTWTQFMSGSSGVTSVTANDTSLTISPTTGAVLAAATTQGIVSGGFVALLYTGAGAPASGTLAAGNYHGGDLYFDTTNEVLYFCDDAGTASTSTWTLVGTGSGGVTSVTANDTSLTISPTTGAVLAAATTQGIVSGGFVELVYKGAGAPSGSTLAAGNYHTGDLYYDTTNNVMYFCNAAGNASTSTWLVVRPVTSVTAADSTLTITPTTGAVTAKVNAASVFPTLVHKKGSNAGDYSSSSTSFVDVDATNLSYTVTIPTGWALHIVVQAAIYLAAVSGRLAIYDSVPATQVVRSYGAGQQGASITLPWQIAGDDASHTIKMQFATTNAADTIFIGNSSGDIPTMCFILTPTN